MLHSTSSSEELAERGWGCTLAAPLDTAEQDGLAVWTNASVPGFQALDTQLSGLDVRLQQCYNNHAPIHATHLEPDPDHLGQICLRVLGLRAGSVAGCTLIMAACDGLALPSS